MTAINVQTSGWSKKYCKRWPADIITWIAETCGRTSNHMSLEQWNKNTLVHSLRHETELSQRIHKSLALSASQTSVICMCLKIPEPFIIMQVTSVFSLQQCNKEVYCLYSTFLHPFFMLLTKCTLAKRVRDQVAKKTISYLNSNSGMMQLIFLFLYLSIIWGHLWWSIFYKEHWCLSGQLLMCHVEVLLGLIPSQCPKW